MKIATLTLADLAATKRLGFFLAKKLMIGDVLALQGALGAGKSELARAIIQQVCPNETDIPSPTFTLVQTYEPDDGPPVMHFDLYRFEAPEEALDLGIEDAFVDAVCLVEWPERLGPWLPRHALRITLEPDPSTPELRVARLSGGARWQQQFGKLAAEMV